MHNYNDIDNTPAPWDEQAWQDPPWDGQADQPEVAQPRPEVPRKQTTLASLLSGGILARVGMRRAYPYIIFLVVLMFLYIANAFRSQRIYRERAALTEQVKELRAKSMTIASEKMQATLQTSIMTELQRRGIPLRESLTPNKVIPHDNGTSPPADR